MNKKNKKIAVIVRDRPDEAFRMAVGLTVLGDSVDVYMLDIDIEMNENLVMSAEALQQMGGIILANHPEQPFGFVSTQDAAQRFAHYDVVLPY